MPGSYPMISHLFSYYRNICRLDGTLVSLVLTRVPFINDFINCPRVVLPRNGNCILMYHHLIDHGHYLKGFALVGQLLGQIWVDPLELV